MSRAVKRIAIPTMNGSLAFPARLLGASASLRASSVRDGRALDRRLMTLSVLVVALTR